MVRYFSLCSPLVPSCSLILTQNISLEIKKKTWSHTNRGIKTYVGSTSYCQHPEGKTLGRQLTRKWEGTPLSWASLYCVMISFLKVYSSPSASLLFLWEYHPISYGNNIYSSEISIIHIILIWYILIRRPFSFFVEYQSVWVSVWFLCQIRCRHFVKWMLRQRMNATQKSIWSDSAERWAVNILYL